MKTRAYMTKVSAKTAIQEVPFGSFFEANNNIYVKIMEEGDCKLTNYFSVACVLSSEDTEDYSLLGRKHLIRRGTLVNTVDTVSFDLKDI